jgi:hypothetical protein
MTPTGAFVIALIAGWIVRDRRRAALMVVTPWLAVLAVQTWWIADGRALSPPDTVSQVGYWFVQAIALACGLGMASELSAWRTGRAAAGPGGRLLDGQAGRAAALCAAAAIVIIGVFLFVHPVFQTGPVSHHSADGSPPLMGIVGLPLAVITFAVLAVVNLRSRRASREALPVASGAPAQPR